MKFSSIPKDFTILSTGLCPKLFVRQRDSKDIRRVWSKKFKMEATWKNMGNVVNMTKL